jgi:hypothetical protein
MTDSELIEQMIARHGESYRRLCVEALRWLNENEPGWNLDRPSDKREFLEGLISNATPNV